MKTLATAIPAMATDFNTSMAAQFLSKRSLPIAERADYGRECSMSAQFLRSMSLEKRPHRIAQAQLPYDLPRPRADFQPTGRHRQANTASSKVSRY